MKQYNVKDLICTFGTISLNRGMKADGEVISIGRTSESASLTAGLYIDVATLHQDETGTATFTVLAASEINADLHEMLVKQKETNRVQHAPFLCKDYSGKDVAFSAEAFLAGPPAKSYDAKGEPALQWTLLCPRLEMTYGGASNV